MPHINTWEEKGLHRKFTGLISGEEILESNFKLHIHPEFKNIKYIINDFTEITDHEINTSHTTAYAKSDDIIAQTKGKLKIAIVVNKEELLALANEYRKQMMGKLFECQIFQTVEEARSWANKTG